MQIVVAEKIGTRFFWMVIVRVNYYTSWKVEGIKTNFTATDIFIWNFLKLGDKPFSERFFLSKGYDIV